MVASCRPVIASAVLCGEPMINGRQPDDPGLREGEKERVRNDALRQIERDLTCVILFVAAVVLAVVLL